MKVLAFRLRGELMAIDIAAVKEVDRKVRCTTVPTANQNIIGLYNMRGHIVTIYDLANILGYPEEPVGEQLNCVILKPCNAEICGFAVDYAIDVIEIDEGTPPPDNMHDKLKQNLSFVTRTSDGLLLLIDHNKAFNIELANTQRGII